MAERIVGKGHIVKVAQDDYDDGIQEIVVFLSDGTHITQKREWPDLVFRGDSSGNGAHGEYLALTHDGEWPPELVYELIQRFSRLIEGPDLAVDTTVPAVTPEGYEHATE